MQDDRHRPEETVRITAVLAEQTADLRRFLGFLLPTADADDVLQDLTVAVLEDPAPVLTALQPGAYLRGMARNLARQHRRRFRRHALIEDLACATWTPLETDDDDRERTALARCTSTMRPEVREIIALRYGEGLSAEAIAPRLAMSSSGVRMALKRGRDALLRCVQQRLKDLHHGQ